jgi:hypothetical protein
MAAIRLTSRQAIMNQRRPGASRNFVHDYAEKARLRAPGGFPVSRAKLPTPNGLISNASPAPRSSAFQIRAGRVTYNAASVR